MNKTALNESHFALGAKMVNFSDWEMPISYSSLIEEHNAVRGSAGIFDVSHMAVFDFLGGDQIGFFKKIFANDIKKVSQQNKAIYGALLDENGCILDDLIIYHSNNKFRLVSNCSTREQNKRWYQKYAKEFNVEVVERSDMGILAIQGPKALKKIVEIDGIDAKVNDLDTFGCFFEGDKLFARTGYTGEDGIEIIDALVKTELATSKREARTFIESGAVSINSEKVQENDTFLTKDNCLSGLILLKRGKKQLHLLEIK